MMKFKSILLLCLIFAPQSSAHDLYLLPDSFHAVNGTKLRVAFHNGDSFPASEVAPKVGRLKDAQVRGKSGVSVIQNLQITGKETVGTVTVSAIGSLLASVHTLPNFIELAPDKFTDYLKEEGQSDVIDWRAQHGESGKPGRERYSKFAKALLQSGSSDDFFQHSLGFPIEIVPMADPYGVKAGGSLPVRVLFRGKPAAGFQVEAAWTAGGQSKTFIVGRTDANGTLAVPVAKAGKWRLHSLTMERCSDPKAADWESFWASLTFETP